MVYEQCVKVKWNATTKALYIENGYVFTKMGDTFWVDLKVIQKITPKSGSYMSIKCDYCGEFFNRSINAHTKRSGNSITKRDCCGKGSCIFQKKTEGTIAKYGVENPQQNNDVKEKTKQTTLKRYGVEVYFLHDDFKEKSKQTSLSNFGVDHSSRSEIVINKRRATNLTRYGHINAAQGQEIKEKIAKAYSLNGTTKTSTQQVQVYEMLKNEGYNVELNYPVSNYNLDVGLFIEGIKIDVEYDGWYWHQDKEKDIKRDNFMKSQGWKVLRIRSRIDIPSIDSLKKCIEELISIDKSFKQIVLDDWREAELQSSSQQISKL